MNILEQFIINGVWWLASVPQRRVAGILKYNPKGWSKLELISTVSLKLGLEKIGDFFEAEVILGIALDGQAITLYDCFEETSTFNSGGLFLSSVLVQTIFMGHHFENAKSVKFKRMYFNFSNLDEWLNIRTIDRIPGKSVWTIKYRKQKEIKLFSSKK